MLSIAMQNPFPLMKCFSKTVDEWLSESATVSRFTCNNGQTHSTHGEVIVYHCFRRLINHAGDGRFGLQQDDRVRRRLDAQMNPKARIVPADDEPSLGRARADGEGGRCVAVLEQCQMLHLRVGQQRQHVVVDVLRRDDQHLRADAPQTMTSGDIEKQPDVHDGTVAGGNVDEAEPAKDETARLEHLVQQVVRLVPLEQQIDQRQRLQLGETEHETLEGGQQLAARTEQLDRLRILAQRHIAREEVIERADPRTAAHPFARATARPGVLLHRPRDERHELEHVVEADLRPKVEPADEMPDGEEATLQPGVIEHGLPAGVVVVPHPGECRILHQEVGPHARQIERPEPSVAGLWGGTFEVIIVIIITITITIDIIIIIIGVCAGMRLSSYQARVVPLLDVEMGEDALEYMIRKSGPPESYWHVSLPGVYVQMCVFKTFGSDDWQDCGVITLSDTFRRTVEGGAPKSIVPQPVASTTEPARLDDE
uniref:Uncharacterized protein n=1 Tax=Anopheles farauti TaxID=69004 RepID=A0A182QQB0_9DIPT